MDGGYDISIHSLPPPPIKWIHVHTYPQHPTHQTKQLHPAIQTRLDAFAEAYSVLKNPRKIDFRPQLGTVTLELAFDNGVGVFAFVCLVGCLDFLGGGVECGSVWMWISCLLVSDSSPPPRTQSAFL